MNLPVLVELVACVVAVFFGVMTGIGVALCPDVVLTMPEPGCTSEVAGVAAWDAWYAFAHAALFAAWVDSSEDPALFCAIWLAVYGLCVP
jgi:hypothetical protein